MRHELTGEIPRVNLVVNSNLCLEQPALRESGQEAGSKQTDWHVRLD